MDNIRLKPIEPIIISDDWSDKTTFSCCGETEVGVFTKKLIALAKKVMQRNGKHNCFCKIEDLMKEGVVVVEYNEIVDSKIAGLDKLSPEEKVLEKQYAEEYAHDYQSYLNKKNNL